MAKEGKEGRVRVGVLFGGRSGEHEVSLVSARSVMGASSPDRYGIVPIGITREGLWRTPAEPGPPEPECAFGDASVEVALWCAQGFRGLVRLSDRPDGRPTTWSRIPLDIVFPLLHGTFGEDGTVQGLIEMVGLPYVGSGVLGSAVGMDKGVMKRLFAAAGLPQVRWCTLTARRWAAERVVVMKELQEALGYPCFVKPANLGSSVGISKVHVHEALAPAIDLAARYDRKVIVEEGIPAREIECSVLGNEEPEASVAGEVIPCKEFYDYEAKYLLDGSQLLIPAPLDSPTMREVQAIALRAFHAVDAAGLARVDFFVHKETGRVYLNEINTMPGFTDISMYPKLWEASGVPYTALIDRLISLGFERHAEQAKLHRSR
ncbi:MAG: D-alanine--D-alanine ligase A [Deltaproteobacteria bacterium RBG_13_65_10]|nr:MAG: D-alanine--D-alanine ligase A [Deltaproteobacteria bacterium RBG_13_65_10]